MHVLAKAYRAAWRSIWGEDPVGLHVVHALDLVIGFGPLSEAVQRMNPRAGP